MFLTEEELKALTKRSQSDAQARVLRGFGIIFKVRPDNSLAVLRSHVEKEMGGDVITTPAVKKTTPNFEALHAS